MHKCIPFYSLVSNNYHIIIIGSFHLNGLYGSPVCGAQYTFFFFSWSSSNFLTSSRNATGFRSSSRLHTTVFGSSNSNILHRITSTSISVSSSKSFLSCALTSHLNIICSACRYGARFLLILYGNGLKPK